MKTKKVSQKLLALLVAALMIVAVGTPITSVSAAGTVTLALTSPSGGSGDNVVVSLNVSANSAIGAATFVLSYNSTKLQYVSSTEGAAAAGGSSDIYYNSAQNKITEAYINLNGLTAGGSLMDVTFKIISATAGSTAVTLTVSELTDAGDYTHYVEPANLAYTASNGTVTYTAPTPPPAPTNLSSTGKTDTSVDLSWTAVTGATGYNVYQGTTKLTSTPITATTYTATGLTQNTPYSFTVTAVNLIGESIASASSEVTTNRDITPPVITIGDYNTSPTNQDITVTASTNEGTLNFTSHLFTANGSFDFVATDAAGNVTTQTVTISNIDKVAPDVATLSADKTDPTKTNVTVTITYPSDAAVAKYKIDSGAWTDYTVPVSVSANCTIYAKGQDNAGNWSDVSNLAISNIDKTPPIITIGDYTTSPTNQDITVTASTNEGTLNFTSHLFTANGSFDFVATDAAGNVTTQTVTISNIDKVAPDVATLSADKTGPTDTNVTVTITFPTDAAVTQYKIDSGAWTDYTVPVSVSANCTIYAKGQDNAGNWSDVSSLIISNIVILGDLNASGSVSAADALMTLQGATGRITLTANQFFAADVNKSGTVTSADALKILQFATGRITSF